MAENHTTATDTPVPYSTGDSKITDATIAEMREIMARYPQAQSALLPMLHLVQSVEGRVTPEGIEVCAELLGLTGAEVSAVATFYTMYKRRPVGDYHVGVCTNTLCAVMGGDLIFDRLKQHLDVGNDETTEDGKITLEHLECNAACDYAPVMMVNWEFFDNQTPESATALVDDLRAGREVRPTRGPRLCTFSEVSRVLAGFPDDLADEGPSAGPATLLGLELFRAQEASAAEPAVPAKKKTATKKASSRKTAAAVDTGGEGTSAHDAPLDTAESDRANDATPGAEETER
jgi:NADH-quinone oxidoreductase subunit E